MERSFLDYAMSVIVVPGPARRPRRPEAGAPPDPLRHARLQGYRPDRPHLKCARVTGDVMGRYHPHGDSAIYDALVRMAQPFSLRHPLDRRPRQLRLARLTARPPPATPSAGCPSWPCSMLDGIDEDTVDMGRNYTNEEDEPYVLPARFPNLLVNGSQGIAVGMATNIPPHNLGEVIDATIHLIDHPDATPDDLMHFVKGPDFPTGGLHPRPGRDHGRLPHRAGLDQDAGQGRDRRGPRRRRADRGHRAALPGQP